MTHVASWDLVLVQRLDGKFPGSRYGQSKPFGLHLEQLGWIHEAQVGEDPGQAAAPFLFQLQGSFKIASLQQALGNEGLPQ
ncbi:MAG: hypothetical protein OXB91_12040 [Bryobacterales bacterium]|nr:hypothetical protein [Bryobacterales bacterium]